MIHTVQGDIFNENVAKNLLTLARRGMATSAVTWNICSRCIWQLSFC